MEQIQHRDIQTSDMGLKKQCKKDEMVTDDMKMVWHCDSDNYSLKKDNS